MAPDAPSTWMGMSRPVSAWIVVELGGDLGDRLVGAGVGDAHDRDDADRVLVDVLLQVVAVEHRVLLGDRARTAARLRSSCRTSPSTPARRSTCTRLGFSVDLPSARRRACQRRLSARPPSMHASEEPIVDVPMAPRRAPARATGRRACVQQRVSMAAVCGILVLVDHVLVGGLDVETTCVVVHPGADEGGEVEAGVAVEHRLVVDHLVGGLGEGLARREPGRGEVRGLTGTGEDGVE